MPEYLNNKYTKSYDSIIGTAKVRGSVLGYSEIHHIIPKSLGGSNRKENLVKLTPKEHFICYRLLPKMTLGIAKNKMLYAIRRMVYKGNIYQDKRYKATSRTYSFIMEQVKAVHSERMKNNNPMHDPSVREVHALAIAERGKTSGMSGKKHKDSTKELMRANHKSGLDDPLVKQKISNSIKKMMSGEDYVNPMHRPGVKENHARSLVLRSINNRTTCPHCNRTFTNNMYARFHGDKCKDRK
jgi:hypothetical protein